MARTRTLFPALTVIVALAVPASASAWRVIHHTDPIKAFKQYGRRPLAHASVYASNLASDWPCTAATTDHTPVISSNAPQVKVIYAYATGDGNFDAATANLMEADAKAVENRIANETNSAKTVRFDTGGSGGTCSTPSHYLDIQKVALSHDRTFYNSPSSGT